MTNQPLKIDYTPISDLIPYARNSRTHNDAQVAQIAANQAHAIATGLKNPYRPNTKVAKIMRSDYVAIYILHKHFGIKRAALAQANRVSRQTIDNVINKVEVACHV